MTWRKLMPEEAVILDKLLSIQFEGREVLRQQLRAAEVEQIDENGSLRFRVDDAPHAQVKRRIPVEAEAYDDDGTTIHVLLHVIGGLLNEMEIYRDDSKPVKALPPPAKWQVLVL